MKKVILEFPSFEARDAWLLNHDPVSRVYTHNPQLATELSDEELQLLPADVTVFPDAQMQPAIQPAQVESTLD